MLYDDMVFDPHDLTPWHDNPTTEKLFLLKSMMRTPTGKELAEKRDQFMRQFVHQIQEEYLMNA